MNARDKALQSFPQYGKTAALMDAIEDRFVKTDDHYKFRDRVFMIHEMPEVRLNSGKFEQNEAA